MSILNILRWAFDLDYLNSSSLDAALQQPFEGAERESWLYFSLFLLASNLKKIFISLFWDSLKLRSWKNSTESSWTIVFSNNNVLHKIVHCQDQGVSIGTILLKHLFVCTCVCVHLCVSMKSGHMHRFKEPSQSGCRIAPSPWRNTLMLHYSRPPILTPGDFESLLSHCDFIPSAWLYNQESCCM